ncbi:MAG: putative polysaccharide deacetylase pdaA precursor [Bacteroidota bacterium]|jgi:peptidoglycan/xylan/chitin deacetylase (PgdA/CDA1 family)
MTYFTHTPFLLPLIYPQFIWRGDTAQRKLYLTFDDGPHPEITLAVLDCLRQHQIKAQFFCVGNNVSKYPSVFQQIIAEGHAVGNHTYHHKNGWATDNEMYFDEVKKTEGIMNSFLPSPSSFSVGEGNRMRSIEKKKEKSDTKFFRPPYGKIKFSQANQLVKTHKIVMWSRLTADFDKSISKEQCLKNAIGKPFKNGEIILFHDSEKANERMEYALPRFIETALEQKFEFGLL